MQPTFSRTRALISSFTVVTALALGLVAVGFPSARAQTPPIQVELLTPRSTFPDDVRGQFRMHVEGRGTEVVNMPDLSRTVVAKITAQPGARFPWHTHDGPVVVNVAQGELTYVSASDCVGREYAAGKAFVDPGHGHVHTAFNSSDGVTVFYSTSFEVPAAGPLTILAPPADC